MLIEFRWPCCFGAQQLRDVYWVQGLELRFAWCFVALTTRTIHCDCNALMLPRLTQAESLTAIGNQKACVN